MDHALQTISYIADIGDLLVIMVRLAVRPPTDTSSPSSVGNGAAVSASEVERRRRRVTICCHIFESDEVSLTFWLLLAVADYFNCACALDVLFNSSTSSVKIQQQPPPPFYGHCTGQPALAGTHTHTHTPV